MVFLADWHPEPQAPSSHPDPPAQVVRNALYQHTGLQTRIHANMVSLVDGRPLQLGLHDMLARFLEFRRAVVQRRTRWGPQKPYDLERNKPQFGAVLAIPARGHVCMLCETRGAATPDSGLHPKAQPARVFPHLSAQIRMLHGVALRLVLGASAGELPTSRP